MLVDVARGQTTSDTGLEDQTKPQIVEDKTLGGKAMKVAFAPGDSIGQRAKVTDWKPFERLRFDVVNPREAVELELNIVHGRSKNYQTRVVAPLTINSGKNAVSIPLGSLTNVNGTPPDLGNVVRWYLADVNNQGPTLLFGTIFLEAAAQSSTAKGETSAPSAGFRITGTIGDQKVDLLAVPADAQGSASAKHFDADPARLARIRAAKMPPIAGPIVFHTPEADAIMSALEIFPENNPWNLVISDWPLHSDSQAIVASIGADKPLRYNADMAFVLVPPKQPRVDVKLTDYAGESDEGPFPVPDNTPIEGWPAYYADGAEKPTLDDVQRDQRNQGGDRHAIVVDPTNRLAYEFYAMKKTDAGWQAAQASVFDLKSNKLRPDSWTSSDAAGFPLIAAVVRYDELQRGLVEHAMRVTAQRTRKAYVYPATHHAGHGDDPNLPRMGERLRLRRDFPVTGFSPEVTAILKGLKKYGMMVADNGLSWSISVTPDPRIPSLHEELRRLKGSDFEVVAPPPGYEPP